KLLNSENFEPIFEQLQEAYPELWKVLLVERDQYLAQKISDQEAGKIVVVIGQAHLRGVEKNLKSNQQINIKELETLPPKLWSTKVLESIIPLIIIGLLIYSFFLGVDVGKDQIMRWGIWNGGLSALFTLLALATSLDLLVSDGEFEQKAGEFLQGQLQDSLEGLKVTVTPIPANVFMERLTKKDFTLSLSGWQADYADPISFLANFETNSPMNHGGYSNKNFDELLKDSSSKRWQELKKAEKLLINDMGVVPIFQVGTAKLEKSKIKNVLMHSIGAKYDYKKMRIEK
ncbi:TraB/GumN family protein, partial [Enterococcus faecalis]|uniref:TraB/GumN family protein n=1 Tax=Enterococcus faecalis TaxID=1351 RepID=UPI00032DAF67